MYFILYDEHMKPIPSVYQYLNFRMKKSPLTSSGVLPVKWTMNNNKF